MNDYHRFLLSSQALPFGYLLVTLLILVIQVSADPALPGTHVGAMTQKQIASEFLNNIIVVLFFSLVGLFYCFLFFVAGRLPFEELEYVDEPE